MGHHGFRADILSTCLICTVYVPRLDSLGVEWHAFRDSRGTELGERKSVNDEWVLDGSVGGRNCT